jgi:hypothetical protein
VTTYIPHLAQIAQRSSYGPFCRPAAWRPASSRRSARVSIEYLAGLIPVVRRRLAIPATFSDAAVFASLTAIAARSSDEQRWRAAETSTLGLFLLSHSADLKACLVTILGLLPKPRH